MRSLVGDKLHIKLYLPKKKGIKPNFYALCAYFWVWRGTSATFSPCPHCTLATGPERCTGGRLQICHLLVLIVPSNTSRDFPTLFQSHLIAFSESCSHKTVCWTTQVLLSQPRVTVGLNEPLDRQPYLPGLAEASQKHFCVLIIVFISLL